MREPFVSAAHLLLANLRAPVRLAQLTESNKAGLRQWLMQQIFRLHVCRTQAQWRTLLRVMLKLMMGAFGWVGMMMMKNKKKLLM